jgi:hypothetical protein
MSMGKGAWQRTPYAETDAKDTDRQIYALLDKYQIRERQWTEHTGAHGRPAVTLTFITSGKTYRVSIESLDVNGVPPDRLIRQAKRVLYWTLKPTLENAIVFAADDAAEGRNAGLERLLLPFLVDNEGMTVYDRIQPHLKQVKAQALITAGRQMAALPAPEDRHPR